MQDVTIIGGGLSGLAAALELEQAGVPYRIIEVKPRLGGSISSVREGEWLYDEGLFGFAPEADWSFLADVGLTPSSALIDISIPPRRPAVALRGGTQQIIEAYARRLTGRIIHRMAVSSLGVEGERYLLCLENGMVWDAGAVIIAAPARFAERMVRTLAPQAALLLEDYPYDTITNVALGYERAFIQDPGQIRWDMGLPRYYVTTHPSRVPAGHILLHLGIRYPLSNSTPAKILRAVQQDADLPPGAVLQRVSYWPEADPLRPLEPNFADWVLELEDLLPAGVAIAGSDYAGTGLAERVASGKAAAYKILDLLL